MLLARRRLLPYLISASLVVGTFIVAACSSDEATTGELTDDGGPGQGNEAGTGPADGASGVDDASSKSDATVEQDAAPGYTPKSIPGLSLWLESTMGVGAQFATWADQSGNGNDAVVSASALAPNHNGGNQNGHQGFVFNGYTTFEIADAASLQLGTGDFLIEAVCHNNWNASTATSTGTSETFYSWYQGSYIRYRFGEVVSKIPSGTTPGLSLVFNDWTDRGYRIIGQISTTAAVKVPSRFYEEEPRVLGFRRKGGVLELRSNGLVTSTTDDAGAEASADVSAVGTKFYVGGRPGLTHFVGAIWEVIVVKGSVSDADVGAFETYAKAKYAL